MGIREPNELSRWRNNADMRETVINHIDRMQKQMESMGPGMMGPLTAQVWAARLPAYRVKRNPSNCKTRTAFASSGAEEPSSAMGDTLDYRTNVKRRGPPRETALNSRGTASGRRPIKIMAIHIGIMCNVCSTVHFIATSPNIKASKLTAGMYRLKCNNPCFMTAEFRKESMQSYRVSEDLFTRGYAREGEYELVR